MIQYHRSGLNLYKNLYYVAEYSVVVCVMRVAIPAATEFYLVFDNP